MAKSHRIPSIRTRLAWLTAACWLPGVLIAALLLVNAYKQGRENVLRDSMATARALLSAVEREFSAAESTLHALATSRPLKNNDMADFHAQASDVLTRSTINNIVLVDATAQQVINTAKPYGQPLPKSSATSQLERVLKTGMSETSNLIIGAVLKKPLVAVTVPVYKGTTVTHALIGVLLPDRIQKIVRDQRFPKDRIAVIFDGTGTLVAHTSNVEKYRGQPVNEGLANALSKSDEGWLENVNLDKVEVLTAYIRSPTSRWGVAISVPREALTADLRESLLWLAGISALLFGISVMLALLMGGRIARAIQQLIGPAQDLSFGKTVHIPTLDVREADEVGRALIQTSIALESTHRRLHAANRAQESSEARMRAIVDTATDAFITVDDEYNILLFNAAAAVMFDCTAEHAIGRPLRLFIPDGLMAQYTSDMGEYPEKRIASGGTNLSTGVRADGSQFKIEFSYSNVVESGATVHTLIIRDVTARIQEHDALVQSNLDLQQFAFVASHDLRTPLRSISGFVEVLERRYAEKLDETAISLIRRTSGAAKRLEQLIDDLLTYARLTSDKKPFELVSCQAVAEETIQLLETVILDTGATIEIDPLPTIMGNRTQLIQLFLNLIGNGIKYCTSRKPVVRLTATKREHGWLITVSDNGIGIAEKHFDSIFQVFKRLHTQQEYPGTGIGLAVCRRVVEHHGGKIWVSSVPDAGSTFSFTFPEA